MSTAVKFKDVLQSKSSSRVERALFVSFNRMSPQILRSFALHVIMTGQGVIWTHCAVAIFGSENRFVEVAVS